MEAMGSIEQRTTPSGYDVREAILSVPERRDDAQTVIYDKLKRGRDAEVPTVPRRGEMASCDLGGLHSFLAQPHHVSKNIHTRPPTERAGSLCKLTTSCGGAKLPSVGSVYVVKRPFSFFTIHYRGHHSSDALIEK